jgi:transcription antitermination factor NusG
MPLLPIEPYIAPPDLLDTSIPWEANSACWWVLHTRPRAEKSLARRFLARNLSFFLPLYQRQWRSKGRLLRSYMPLFPGYIFLRGDCETRLSALETNQVVNTLPVVDPARLQADLVRIYRMMQGGASLTPEDKLQPGTVVEVVEGPLAGLEGKILRRGKELRFFVEIRLLQRGVSVEIEGWMIRPIHRAPANGQEAVAC